MAEKVSLLRRPRPPKQPKTLRVLMSYQNIESPASPREASDTGYRLSSIFGTRSPVPTMHSDYEPNKKLKHSQLVQLRTESISPTGNEESSRHAIVVPYKPRGPEPFPIRLPRQPLEVRQDFVFPEDLYYAKEPPEFCLEDFRLENKCPPPLAAAPHRPILSKANYIRLTKNLQDWMQSTNPLEITAVNLADQCEHLPSKTRRVPKKQVMIEIEKYVQEKLHRLGATSPSRFEKLTPQVGELFEEIQKWKGMEVIGIKSQISILSRATARVFRASKRSEVDQRSKEDDESLITPSELAILNCLMDGGFILSLKAHFISDIPDLSALHSSLIYLNLSFNELGEFPMDVLNCSNLHVLKFRDNPLRGIPSDINRLQHLRTLIVSFCCLTSLPVGLFSIKTLEYLDVSYNKLTFLPSEIKELENLRFLNVEGNELPGLPCGLLRISLFRIRIRNNFMSPVFWKENSTNTAQRLSDICSYYLQSYFVHGGEENYKKFSPDIAKQLSEFSRCDCCRGPMFGPGLRIIRPCTEIWKIRRLPFIFRSCSPTCHHAFVRNTDPRIADLIYGVPSDESI